MPDHRLGQGGIIEALLCSCCPPLLPTVRPENWNWSGTLLFTYLVNLEANWAYTGHLAMISSAVRLRLCYRVWSISASDSIHYCHQPQQAPENGLISHSLWLGILQSPIVGSKSGWEVITLGSEFCNNGLLRSRVWSILFPVILSATGRLVSFSIWFANNILSWGWPSRLLFLVSLLFESGLQRRCQ